MHDFDAAAEVTWHTDEEEAPTDWSAAAAFATLREALDAIVNGTPQNGHPWVRSGTRVYRWLRVEGPEHILSWAAQHDPSIDWEDKYAHRCQACVRLYRDEKVRAIIREKHEEKILDVVVGEWLLFRARE